ncbi:hypothetical protein Tco_0636484, partial [Tanacetum coccineum]
MDDLDTKEGEVREVQPVGLDKARIKHNLPSFL